MPHSAKKLSDTLEWVHQKATEVAGGWSMCCMGLRLGRRLFSLEERKQRGDHIAAFTCLLGGHREDAVPPGAPWKDKRQQG